MFDGVFRAVEGAGHDEERFRRLIDVGSEVLSELDLEAVLQSVVEAARELTGARYAALGVLDPERRELERFINVGIDEETRRGIGNLPRGRGVLGELIREPVPLRLRDVDATPTPTASRPATRRCTPSSGCRSRSAARPTATST